MPLIVPTSSDYQLAEQKIIKFFDDSGYFQDVQQRVDYIIYGSYSTGKVRPGLSDIDIMMIADTEDIIFPLDIGIVFARTKQEIQDLGIPLQINFCTTGLLKSPSFSPDYEYLMEVEKGIERGKSSSDMSQYFTEHRNSDKEDMNMARYFLRKINAFSQNIQKIDHLVMRKTKQDIDINDQKDIWNTWDTFKKMMSLITIILRIQSNKSLFSESDSIILDNFSYIFGNDIDISKYILVLESITNISDWYDFLYRADNDGLRILQEIYTDIFIPMTNVIDRKF